MTDSRALDVRKVRGKDIAENMFEDFHFCHTQKEDFKRRLVPAALALIKDIRTEWGIQHDEWAVLMDIPLGTFHCLHYNRSKFGRSSMSYDNYYRLEIFRQIRDGLKYKLRNEEEIRRWLNTQEEKLNGRSPLEIFRSLNWESLLLVRNITTS